MANLSEHIHHIAFQAKQASREIAKAGPEQKNAALHSLAEILLKKKRSILEANALDIAQAKKNDLSLPKIDRLTTP